MKFLDIFKRVGSIVLGVEHIAAPIAEAFFPQFTPIISGLDRVFQDLQGNIVRAESASPSGGGPQKESQVIQGFADSLSLVQQILATQGQILTYDGAKLQDVIQKQVAAFSAMADLKATFKIQPK